LTKEIWKPIKGYEGIYLINEIGQVKSLPRTDKQNRSVGGVILEPCNRGPRSVYGLTKNEKTKQHYMHVLVADNFNRLIPLLNYEGEKWLKITDMPNYEISNLGRVRHHINTYDLATMTYCDYRVVNPNDNGRGYKQVSVKINKKRITKYVHRLVAEYFLENELKLPEVNHKNGVKSDNRLDNLEWISKSSNMQHAMDHGLSPSGVKKWNAKLNKKQVINIKEAYRAGVTMQHLAEKYDVCIETIRKIICRKTYKLI
jgi:hypothetical protein